MNELLDILSISKPKNYNEFIRLIRNNESIPDDLLDYSKPCSLNCVLLICEVLNNSFSRNKKSNRKLIYNSFIDDSNIVNITEIKEFIRMNFTKIEQAFFLANLE